MKEYANIAVAIPTYNESLNIGRLILAISEKYPLLKIFVVDDNSPDKTGDAVLKIKGENKIPVSLIKRKRKEGLAGAFIEAFRHIQKDKNITHIITMDADFSHDPADIEKIIEQRNKADLIIGSRYMKGAKNNVSLTRRIASYFGNFYVRFLTGIHVRDTTTGFVLYGRKAIDTILQTKIKSKHYGCQIEFKHRAKSEGLRLKEVPIHFEKRKQGYSKLSLSVWIENILIPWYL